MPSTHIDVFPGPIPFEVRHQPKNKCAVIRLDGTAGLNLFLNSPEEADALIVAAVQAKKLLTGEPALPALDSESWTCGGCGGQYIGRRPPAGDRCPTCAGWDAQPRPGGAGRCTCGATVDAHGTVTPAGAS